ncbi:MAG: UDP-N-acetylmuramoyl-tripeptide--D-alanyl-D-alanine ligase [Reichenbachiella sp.]
MSKSTADLYKIFLQSTGVCTDTRTLKKGQLFFALKGPNFNGNAYAEKALDMGASFAIIDKEAFDGGDKYLLVRDVLKALQELSTHHRDQFEIPILGITGSNGKTTTKELLARILSSKFKVHFTKGNLNNHIGVPLTLLAMSKNTDFAIIEMGANHLGDIAELCQLAKPTHGMITNIGSAHLGEFGGRENLIRAKSELFDYLRKTDGVVFINTEDEVLHNMAKRFSNAILYPNKTCQLVVADPYVNYKDLMEEEHATQLIGAYNFMNISAAITISQFFEVDNLYEPIDRYVPDNNRSEILEIGSNKVVLDAYNANPSSMEAALENLVQMKGEKKIALLGEMKELGEYSLEEHKKIVRLADQLGVNTTFWVGNEFIIATDNKDSCFENVDDLIKFLGKKPFSGTTVLIKGSRSVQMEKLTEAKELWT